MSAAYGSIYSYSVGPRDTLPRRANDERVDVYAHHGEVAPTITVNITRSSSSSRIGFHDVSTDVPHRDAAKRSAPNEALATANTFNDDERKGTHAERLRNTIESGREELQGGARDTESFEDAGGVIRDDVDLVWLTTFE